MNEEKNGVRVLVRVAFVLYTMALLTATHWPGLTVEGPINRTDLVIHAGVLFWWTVLLYNAHLVATGDRIGCGCFKRRIVWTAVAGFAFAVFDELTQPMFGRQADPTDLGADAVGVLVACGVIWWWVRIKSSKAGE
jgi:VanZ family protein